MEDIKLMESHFFGGSIKLSEDCKWYMAAIEHEKDDNGIVLTEKMFNDFIKNFKDNVIKCTDTDGKPMLDIDYEHKKDPAYGMDAAGWIDDLKTEKLNQNGKEVVTFWIKPKQWLPKAQEVIKSGAKRFFSIEYQLKHKDNDTGKIYQNVLLGGGLTNRPYIHGLAPVALSAEKVNRAHTQDENKKQKGDTQMFEKLKAMLLSRGIMLSESATDEYTVEKVLDEVKQLSEKAEKAVKLSEQVISLEKEKDGLTDKLSESTTKIEALEVIALSTKKAEAESSLKGKMTPAQLKDEKNYITKLLKEKKYDAVIALSEMLPVLLKEKGTDEPDGDEEDDSDKKGDRLWDELEPDEKIKKTEKHMEKPDAPKKFEAAAAEAKRAHNDKVMKAREKSKEAK
jgi:hypothetical protein